MVYKIKNVDEAFISGNSVRTNYKKYYNWFNNQNFSNLTKKNSKKHKDKYFILKVYKKDQSHLDYQGKDEFMSPYFKEMSDTWAQKLSDAIHTLPKFEWEEED